MGQLKIGNEAITEATRAEIVAAFGIKSSEVSFTHPGVGVAARTVQDKLRDTVSVKDAPFGAAGDGIADDTAAIQAALNSGRDIVVPETSAFYKVSATLLQTVPGQAFTNNGTIKMVVSDGLKRPLMVVSQAAVGSVRNGIGTYDHNADQWPTSAMFDPTALGGNTSDARGIGMVVMADQSADSDYTFINGWDSGVGIGNFSLINGAQSAGPDGWRGHNIKTINCGTGRHNWGPAPGGFYYQGVGIGVLTATNFNVTGCTDFGSYGSFWADINGGGHGVFTGCVSIEAKQGAIWSDAANGSNQIWYTDGVFGGNLTGAGAGWLKTPGGVAFMSGTYGVSFVNCTAFEPAWIGFALDQWSSKCSLTNCRVVKSGGPGIIDAGQQNEFTNIQLEDCCRQVGTVSPSGSTCPPLGAFETMGAAPGLVNPQIINLNVTPERVYPGSSPGPVKYSYALWARRSASAQASRISVIGGRLTNGVTGRANTDTDCEISAMSSSGGEMRYEVFGTAAAKLAFEQGGVRGLSIDQTSDDNITITSEVAGKNLIIGQNGNGTAQFWVNGVKRAEIGATNIFLNSLPTSAPVGSGALWRDAGAGNVVKVVP
jgi:hypothetical protein